jgi:hypothetical protein
MKRHLTEQELIEYQFKLATEAQMEEIADHLQDCVQCSERLEELERKFAALDLLREEPKVSEDLISQVIEQARKPVQAKVVPIRKRVWIAAAAAVLLIGLLLLSVPDMTEDRIKKPDLGEKLARTVEYKGTIPETDVMQVAKMDIKDELGRPPFAPASAIELVTLPRREKVQLTIYNSADLTLVRERRNLTLKKGWNWLQFMWANTLIDPTSLSLEPLKQADKIDIQQLVFPARLRELGRWLIRSEVSGQVPFEITYFTSGLNWRAFYMGTLSQDEKTMHLQGYVRVGNNSGEDYENAQTRLIVGKVHILDKIADLAKRRYPYDRPERRFYEYAPWYAGVDQDKVPLLGDIPTVGLLFRGEELGRKEIKKEGLSEYFLYTIEGTETIPDKWGKRLLSFEAEDIEVKSLYKYDEQRWGPQTIRFVAFANDEEHNLGETPIPNGTMKIYSQADEQDYLSYVGGTSVKYIPVDEEIELNLGPARLVRVQPKLMNFETDNYMFDKEGNISGWDETRAWKIEVTNTRELPVEVEITRGFETEYWTLQLDDKEVFYEKHDVTHARFKAALEPRSKRTFGYEVTTYHGIREEALTRIKK